MSSTPPTPFPGTSSNTDSSETPNKQLVQGGPEWWRRTFVYMTGMGLTDDEKTKWEADYKAKKAVDECKRCDEWKEFSLNYSPIVRFMADNIRKLGGNLDSSNITCAPCDTVRAGGFSPDHGILLCSNYMMGKGHAEDTIAHEMVHAWDHLRFKVDWGNIRHHACSEIRASSLSGECRWTRETFTRGIWDYTAHHQACVRRRAALSVRAHPDCKDEDHAKKVVNEVFDSCFADTRPFDEIYR